MKPHYKLFTYLTLFPLCIIAMGYIGTYKQTPKEEPYVKVPVKFRDDIVNMLSNSVTEGYSVKCWTVDQSEKVLTPSVNVINYLKALKVDSTGKK